MEHSSRRITNTHCSGLTDGESLNIRVADARELAESLRKRMLIYREMLGHHGVDEYDRTSLHIVALRGGLLVAALRLVGPTPLTVELSRFINLERSPFDSARLMQIGGFWAEGPMRRVTRDNTLTVKRLFQKSVELASRFGCGGIIMRTVPRLRPWYSGFGFKVLPNLNYWDPHWGHVVTMYLRIEHFAQGAPFASRDSWQGPLLGTFCR
ncbi:hypothetical protein HRbin30_00946 [bacterium HR30]|nr:hypothetical protein HRbin30_00946 [bacterium HR30]